MLSMKTGQHEKEKKNAARPWHPDFQILFMGHAYGHMVRRALIHRVVEHPVVALVGVHMPASIHQARYVPQGKFWCTACATECDGPRD